MDIAIVERGIALLASILVGGPALYQLKNELSTHGLDATATKVLLSLLVVGCVVVLFASINVLGNFAS
jgi:hypothetical protein